MIAFLVIAHADPEQLRRLVRRLSPHDVYVHLDAKTALDDLWSDIEAEFITDRVPVYWGGFSQVEATISLLKVALGKNKDYDRIVLLSGSCYPIRSVPELEALFHNVPERNFIKYVDVNDAAHLSELIDHYHFRGPLLPWRATARSRGLNFAERVLRRILETACRPLTRRRLRFGTPFHGSAYWAITSPAARHILDTVSGAQGAALKKYYRGAFASDEQFFHTIIGNSEFAETSTGRRQYAGRGTYRMANLHLIDPSLTKWYGLEDMADVLGTEMYFVRKVRSTTSASLLDQIDQRVDGLESTRL